MYLQPSNEVPWEMVHVRVQHQSLLLEGWVSSSINSYVSLGEGPHAIRLMLYFHFYHHDHSVHGPLHLHWGCQICRCWVTSHKESSCPLDFWDTAPMGMTRRHKHLHILCPHTYAHPHVCSLKLHVSDPPVFFLLIPWLFNQFICLSQSPIYIHISDHFSMSTTGATKCSA